MAYRAVRSRKLLDSVRPLFMRGAIVHVHHTGVRCSLRNSPDRGQPSTMSTLEKFRSELSSRVKAAGNAPRWKTQDADAYMAARRKRRQQFDDAARSLVVTVIKPRLEATTALFPSARAMADEQACRCWCWFACSDRFPVTAKIEFALEHDES